MTPIKKTEYVLGFLHNPATDKVVLITKRKDSRFPGALNGVGGHIEEFDASEHAAMAREFKEEAGLDASPLVWEEFATIRSAHSVVYCFKWSASPTLINSVKTMTDEPVGVYDMGRILAGEHNCVHAMLPLIAAIKFPHPNGCRININIHD